MRKVFAIITTILTFLALKEGFNLLMSTDKAIAGQKPILIVIAISIILPLLFLSFWLWRPNKKKADDQ